MSYLVIQVGQGSDDEGTQCVFTNNNSASGVPGTDPSAPPYDGRQHSWLPFDTTVQRVAIRVTAAPGASKTANYRIHKDANADISNILSITGASSTDVSADVEEDIEALITTDDTTIRGTIHYLSLWPDTVGNAAGVRYAAYEYFTATHPGYTWHVCGVGGDAPTASFGPTDQYSAICDHLITTAVVTQDSRQHPMPIFGKVKYAFAIWKGWTATTTVEAVLQQGTLGGGVDTAIAFTMVGAATTALYQATLDSSTEVVVAQDDFLVWRFKRTSGAATTGSIVVGFGFAPGLT